MPIPSVKRGAKISERSVESIPNPSQREITKRINVAMVSARIAKSLNWSLTKLIPMNPSESSIEVAINFCSLEICISEYFLNVLVIIEVFYKLFHFLTVGFSDLLEVFWFLN